MQMSSTMSTLSAVYTKQSQRVSAAHGAGWPPSLDDATGAGPFPAREAGLGQQIHISQDARLRALGLDGELDQVPPMLKDKLQGNLLDMMLERLTGERGGDQAFTYPSATADMFGWFAERYGVPRPPRHRPQSFGATMASITAQSQSVQFSAQALVSDSEGKDVQLSVELAMAKTSVGVSVAALQNTQMSGAQIASFGGLSSRATQASFQFNLGVLWNGLSATSAGSGAESQAQGVTDEPGLGNPSEILGPKLSLVLPFLHIVGEIPLVEGEVAGVGVEIFSYPRQVARTCRLHDPLFELGTIGAKGGQELVDLLMQDLLESGHVLGPFGTLLKPAHRRPSPWCLPRPTRSWSRS